MINGIPVVASNVAGLKDAVGTGGILLEKQDVNAWVKEIEKLMMDEGYYSEIVSKGREFVKRDYSEEKIIESFCELLKTE